MEAGNHLVVSLSAGIVSELMSCSECRFVKGNHRRHSRLLRRAALVEWIIALYAWYR